MTTAVIVILTLVVAVPVGIGHALLSAWVIRVVWPWFFATTAPPYALIVGTVYLFRVFLVPELYRPTPKDVAEAWCRLRDTLIAALLGPFVVLGMSWVLHQFVTARPWP